MDGSRGSGSVTSQARSLFHRGSLELAIAPSAVGVARHWTAKLLAGPAATSSQAALDPDVVDAAVLAVSELVTNAIRAVSQATPAAAILPGRLLSSGNPVCFTVLPGSPERPKSGLLAGTTFEPMPASVSLVVSRFADMVRIDVHDSSPLPLQSARDHDADDETGRGLTVVAALAESWGWRPEPFGKVVWCELAVTMGHAGPDRGG
ncbi:MAG: ATP-binding protein [Streptosporangiaceae bacterium]